MLRLTDLDITGLTADSQSVEPGFLFAALPGTKVDGRTFIDEAVDRGASAVLALDGTALDRDDIQLITDANPRRLFAQLAAKYFVTQPEITVAVTGTNGKTSVAQFVRQIWQHAGHKAAALGTLGVVSDDLSTSGSLTTPDPVTLHKLLSDLAGRGVDRLALEASSHGLDQFRLDGVRVSAAAFTNLSRDHLDYHGTMDAYLSAKVRLFSDVLIPGGVAVLNADTPECASIKTACEARGHTAITYGYAGDAIRLVSTTATAHGQELDLLLHGKVEHVALPLAGGFQAMNALCAAGLALATGMTTEQVIDALAALDGVPGRLERVGATETGASVFVDYAHTPDALTIALNALRPHAKGKLAVVFGAGGDRDAGKRPLMGQAAQDAADIAYVTDDNPRSEDPAIIRAAILKNCSDAIEVDDRADAIESAISSLDDGDVLLIAGKGHETGQIVGETILPFDDRDVARAALKKSGGAS
ncbi:MAG: UDP-N-acetylmuramoyl-L-alanyl-D-glutamate--2,6-diaminopimelate ligase [Rhodospirillaceae bacterium]|nr:UDP-N-acetylmuramoyl-L-alanyl-D-glutamate--2,6-diaminopimelate ligase [Rhodospirillaceae bacterium]MBT5239891.1 UDP-N-acetylmuramoyl-L-alanyl-D-glutamate--2,6-diaminopimelate ligase [Rhodospirillaceae bacterium]MBT5565233.1 UDP-N-acetylmuramoyl-L-alanyl-D-glutamate--2,6-diaminopimelate ligase [Rhodospirillaceae bacterium]MBT6091091.1 UDP-N-acetylmuramoyl-L-alanyl-D-glutamate--2,6-diaminopimelate ligase [Rhodospirillaceae bacterium]MBT7450916.1 UDP-N-acetylmuramoyl-L-alanyl-D-glutamate--2,6-d